MVSNWYDQESFLPSPGCLPRLRRYLLCLPRQQSLVLSLFVPEKDSKVRALALGPEEPQFGREVQTW